MQIRSAFPHATRAVAQEDRKWTRLPLRGQRRICSDRDFQIAWSAPASRFTRSIASRRAPAAARSVEALRCACNLRACLRIVASEDRLGVGRAQWILTWVLVAVGGRRDVQKFTVIADPQRNLDRAAAN